jgi:3-mercaptopyruvate sulfurtransferase SseA
MSSLHYGVSRLTMRSTLIDTVARGRRSRRTIVLMILGYENARTYAGSYAQWASQEDLPVESG